MIITRAPLRIPLGGGGTDLPSFYKKHGGFFISAAINKYIQITLSNNKSKIVSQIKHELTKATLKFMEIDDPLEVISTSDVPPGTGMGSSGSFLVTLLKALHTHKNEDPSPAQIAKEACFIEIQILKKPAGVQDQYISSFGGINQFDISKSGQVKVTKLNLPDKTIQTLEQNLVIFFTGITRKSEEILGKMQNKTSIESLQKIKEIGQEIKLALVKGDLDKFGKLMHLHWQVKKQLSSTSSSRIDTLYELGLKNGALGGKIMGAGGGGYLLFYCPKNQSNLRSQMTKVGLTELLFNFEFEGVKVIKR